MEEKVSGELHSVGAQTPMPSLTIKPPRPPSENNSTSPPQPDKFTFSVPPPANVTFAPPHEASSPIAPEYSPITPKVQPALPACDPENAVRPPPAADTNTRRPAPAQSMTSPMQYMPPPLSQPFSSEDSTDAIALRAAISTLQFQKKKAQEDLRILETTKKQALQDPHRFRGELIAGRLREQRPQVDGLQAIIDQAESDGDESDDEEARSPANQDDRMDTETTTSPQKSRPADFPNSKRSRPPSSSSVRPPSTSSMKPVSFSQIPGAQNVVRMPHINWEKYHIVGEVLEQMHEQQRRWPGVSLDAQDKGREFSVAAPYSPFHDVLEANEANGRRKDSAAVSTSLTMPTGNMNEHSIEARRKH